jgi:hypothetical protein
LVARALPIAEWKTLDDYCKRVAGSTSDDIPRRDVLIRALEMVAEEAPKTRLFENA